MENPIANAPSSIEWVRTLELGYNQPKPSKLVICFGCGSTKSATNQEAKTQTNDGIPTSAEDTTNPSSNSNFDSKPVSNPPPLPTQTKLSKCSKCHVAAYCSRNCQIQDWKHGRHKLACPSYARLQGLHPGKSNIKKENNPKLQREQEENGQEQTSSPEINSFLEQTKADIRLELFTRIRFYACPYAIYRTSSLGKGFLFLQANYSIYDMSYAIPKDMFGHPMMDRGILMHFLTLGEFDLEVCRDDFELTMVRTELQGLVEGCDTNTHVVLLWRFRCGHVAVGKAILVPDYAICKALGKEYYAEQQASSNGGAIQLNLDDI